MEYQWIHGFIAQIVTGNGHRGITSNACLDFCDTFSGDSTDKARDLTIKAQDFPRLNQQTNVRFIKDVLQLWSEIPVVTTKKSPHANRMYFIPVK